MRKTLSLLLSLIMAISMLSISAFAAEPWGGLTVESDKTTAEQGETINYTVYLDDCSSLEGGVWNVEFMLSIPAGLNFVEGSGKIDASFGADTRIDGMDFNPANYKVSGLGALAAGYTGGKIAVLTFSCVAADNVTGDLTIGLTDTVLTANGGLESKTPTVTPATVAIAEKHVHSFGGWQSDADNHWKACECGEKSELAAHSWKWVTDKEATTAEAGKKHEECSVCGFKRGEGTEIPKLEEEHKHSFGGWNSDADNHWKACACGEKSELAAHSFTWVIDKEATIAEAGAKHEECSVCGFKRSEGTEIPRPEEDHVHNFGEWNSDADDHWKVCACGQVTELGSHDFGNWVTVGNEKIKTCDTCGYEVKEAVGVTSPSTGDASNIALWMSLLLVSCAGAVVTVICYKKKYN